MCGVADAYACGVATSGKASVWAAAAAARPGEAAQGGKKKCDLDSNGLLTLCVQAPKNEDRAEMMRTTSSIMRKGGDGKI